MQMQEARKGRIKADKWEKIFKKKAQFPEETKTKKDEQHGEKKNG